MTPNNASTTVTRRRREIRSLALRNAWRRRNSKPSRVKNRLKPTAAWVVWTRVIS